MLFHIMCESPLRPVYSRSYLHPTPMLPMQLILILLNSETSAGVGIAGNLNLRKKRHEVLPLRESPNLSQEREVILNADLLRSVTKMNLLSAGFYWHAPNCRSCGHSTYVLSREIKAITFVCEHI